MNKYTILLGLIVAAPFVGAAENGKKLNSELEIGIITTSGNTNTESYKGKLNVEHELKHWRNHYILEGLSKQDELEVEESGETVKKEQTTAERYFASAQADYKIDEDHKAFFLYGEYDRNRFSGFDYQYTVAIGYSNRLFKTDNSELKYSVGPGYTVDKPEPLDGVEQRKEETAIARISAEYRYLISENAKFKQTLSSNYALEDDRNSKTRAVSSLTAQINTHFALRASVTLEYNSEIPEDREYADTETSLTLVYNF